MKNLIFTLLIIGCALNTNATVKTSVVDGDWNSPSTWSPASVPFGEDTVIINSNVSTDELVDVLINTLIVNNGFTLQSSNTFGLHGNLFNYGTINTSTLAIGDGTYTENNGIIRGTFYAVGNETMRNNGIIESDSLVIGNPLFENYGSINNLSIATGDQFNNYSIISTFSFIGGSDLVNNGDIEVENLTFGSANVSGENGKFCISGCFINVANLSGTIDFCDATETFCDINVGTIAASVTFCAVSPCFDNLKIEENNSINKVDIYPNPAVNNVTISLPESNKLAKFSVAVYSLNGVLLINQHYQNVNAIHLDISKLSAGSYLCVINGTNFTEQKLIMIQ